MKATIQDIASLIVVTLLIGAAALAAFAFAPALPV